MYQGFFMRINQHYNTYKDPLMFRVLVQVIGLFELYSYYKKFREKQKEEEDQRNDERNKRKS